MDGRGQGPGCIQKIKRRRPRPLQIEHSQPLQPSRALVTGGGAHALAMADADAHARVDSGGSGSESRGEQTDGGGGDATRWPVAVMDSAVQLDERANVCVCVCVHGRCAHCVAHLPGRLSLQTDRSDPPSGRQQQRRSEIQSGRRSLRLDCQCQPQPAMDPSSSMPLVSVLESPIPTLPLSAYDMQIAMNNAASAVAAATAAAAADEAEGRSARAAGRLHARLAAEARADEARAGGFVMDEHSILRAQAAREREAETQMLMAGGDFGGHTAAAAAAASHAHMDVDDESVPAAAAAAATAPSQSRSKHRGSSAAGASAGATKESSSRSGVLLDDVEVSAEDLALLDTDTRSRTQHNKAMRAAIREGQIRQDRYIKKHIEQMRPFLTPKVLRRYVAQRNNDDEGGEGEGEGGAATAADEDAVRAQNIRAGAAAAQLSHINPDGTRVDLPPTAEGEELADLRDEQLPKSKVFVTQPPYIINGVMREYQILGLNWMINRHESQ